MKKYINRNGICNYYIQNNLIIVVKYKQVVLEKVTYFIKTSVYRIRYWFVRCITIVDLRTNNLISN